MLDLDPRSRSPVLTAAPVKDPLRYVIAASVANGLAFMVPNTSPFVVGALIEGFPMSAERAGFVLTMELVTMGIAALFAAPLTTVVSRRWLAIAGAVLVALANAAVSLEVVAGFAALLAARVLAGAGAGLLLATANAAIAESVSPARLYGFALMAGWLSAAVLGPGMAFAVTHFGYRGAYGVWMVFAAIAALLVGGIGDGKVVGAPGPRGPLGARLAGLAHISGVVLVGLSMMAYFAFVERLGQRAGFTLEAVGYLFAGICVSGALGAGLAGVLGERLGLLGPLVFGTVLHSIAIVVAVDVMNPALFVVGAIGEGFTFMYLLAYQLAAAAALDSTGRWAAATSGAFLVSTGVGPFVGGVLIAGYGFQGLGVLNVAAPLLAIALFALAMRMRPSR